MKFIKIITTDGFFKFINVKNITRISVVEEGNIVIWNTDGSVDQVNDKDSLYRIGQLLREKLT